MSGKKLTCIGVDIGTSSIAAVVVDCCGKILKSATVPNPSLSEPTEDGIYEQDAVAISEAVNDLIADCEAAVLGFKLESTGIGWTGQMHGLVAVDENLEPLTSFVTWRDRRCAPPELSVGILDDWRNRKVKNIYRVLTIPGYVIARRTGCCMVDCTFRAAMGDEKKLARYEKWIPETDDSHLGMRCIIPEVEEMAAWGAALYARDQITFDHR